jgi:1,4-dihydroxy-2-naphthoate octaprenyltransferase
MWQGVLKLARPVPLLTWTATTVALGTAAAGHLAPGWGAGLAAVTGGGALLQGYVTHGFNDLYDWASGTDQTTPGTLSGGSHAVREGLLTPLDLRRLAIGGSVLYLALLIWAAANRSPWLLPLGVAALLSAVLYSVPPARLCYRPWSGEWAGIFPPLAAGVLATGLAVGLRFDAVLLVTAIIQGVLCVGSVMEHHLADIASDWQAVPQKRTSPAYWKNVRGRAPSEIAAAYDGMATALAIAAAVVIGPRFWWCASMAGLSAVLAWRTRVGDLADEIRRDWYLKLLALANAAGYVVMAAIGVP